MMTRGAAGKQAINAQQQAVAGNHRQHTGREQPGVVRKRAQHLESEKQPKSLLRDALASLLPNDIKARK